MIHSHNCQWNDDDDGDGGGGGDGLFYKPIVWIRGSIWDHKTYRRRVKTTFINSLSFKNVFIKHC